MKREDSSINTSQYINDTYYQRLVSDFTGWRRDSKENTDHIYRDACRRFLNREARILDEGRLEDWLKLFTSDCLYWVPGSANGGDPRKEVAISFDDRRRLEDRIFRIATGTAWSQHPTSRTNRLISNIEVYTTGKAEIIMVRSNFQTTEFRVGQTQLWSGWYTHRLLDVGNEFKILVKQVNLINFDQNLRNPSFIL